MEEASRLAQTLEDSGNMDQKEERITDAARDSAALAKTHIEESMAALKLQQAEREQRYAELNERLADPSLSREEKAKIQEDFRRQEREMMRSRRKRMGKDDFENIVMLGRGAFGEVRLVRKNDSGEIFAMKVMVKEATLLKNQTSHVKAERDAMAGSDNAGVVRLHYAFQVQ